ncbi:8-oxo-dGTP diphosphatase [Jeotgalibacillus sp. R-1-5s-1]|uniref:8-oxo-dGTP diphosphatase n=1 Tax=Jeotgalibacillus sp. R-1-5s-1 TaxID=2555897 RepID=UPI001068FAE4|nr:8-oxo-dGTP diphosphatase [Jeotgalibacillus sp. R-1-5s-1]TFE00216.1 8-oxo-dGTP diphosphatase [Jeotgalibacillus sp. R-1-5s-1]
MCMIEKDDKVLMIDRQHGDFRGFIPPGGKVDFPESFSDSAIREVKEETGLAINSLIYKGLYEYVNPHKQDRYMIFHYLTDDFEGELLAQPPEGELVWVDKKELHAIPMQDSVRRRIPYFFQDGTFEIHVEWDGIKDGEREVRIREL